MCRLGLIIASEREELQIVMALVVSEYRETVDVVKTI